ncbi:hypothetical protein Cantr_07310 [Candida viswanathii]|uniref:Uncharacterized protein n=1 Tax=Candida viswanathii TaxID=5486 RepID=A0A367Y1A0_9ASCO|nr:hypothetical protein Cantr_07310 [Candida viswanathii]
MWAIFNYEKTESPIVNSTLYFLRRSQDSIDLLDWVLISRAVGHGSRERNKGTGVVKLKATRESKLHPFDVELFVLEIDGLMDQARS